MSVALLLALVVVPLAEPAAADPPPAPSAINAQPLSSGSTRFVWASSAGATQYKLLCEQQGYPDAQVITSFLEATLRLPPLYTQCTVRAGNASGYSTTFATITILIANLLPPTGLAATAYSGEVNLTWTDPVSTAINGWRVTSTPASIDREVGGESADGAVIRTIVQDLPVNMPYTFHLQPFRSSDMGRAYGPTLDFASTTVLPTPGAPTVTDIDWDLNTPTASMGHIDVWWAAPTANGSPPIDKYRLVVSREGPDLITEYGPAKRFGTQGLAVAEAAYNIRVQARNANGWGPPSSPGINLGMIGKPAPPANLMIRTDAPTGAYPVLRAFWDKPSDLTGYPASVAYDVRIEGPSGYVATSASTHYENDTPLADGWYQAKVRAKGVENNSPWLTRWFAIGSPCDATFSDVTSPPFCTPVSWMVRQGIGGGFSDGTFKPSGAVTRQAMASFLYKAKGSPNGPTPTCTTAPFPDVPANHPFCGQIKWLVDQGITAGYPDGTFRPTGAVSRQAMASFLYKASSVHHDAGGALFPLPACDPPGPFTDVSASHPFCGYIAVLLDDGITSGYPDGTFQPAATVSRQAMAAFLYRWAP